MNSVMKTINERNKQKEPIDKDRELNSKLVKYMKGVNIDMD